MKYRLISTCKCFRRNTFLRSQQQRPPHRTSPHHRHRALRISTSNQATRINFYHFQWHPLQSRNIARNSSSLSILITAPVEAFSFRSHSNSIRTSLSLDSIRVKKDAAANLYYTSFDISIINLYYYRRRCLPFFIWSPKEERSLQNPRIKSVTPIRNGHPPTSSVILYSNTFFAIFIQTFFININRVRHDLVASSFTRSRLR